MRQNGSVVAVRQVTSDNSNLDGALLNGITTSSGKGCPGTTADGRSALSSPSTSQCCTMSQAQQRRGLARGFLDPVPHIGKQEPLPPRYYARQRVVVPTPVGFHQRSLHLTPFRIARISSDASEVSIRRSLIVAALICLRRKRRNLAAHQRRCGSDNHQYPNLPVPVPRYRQSGRKWAVAWHAAPQAPFASARAIAIVVHSHVCADNLPGPTQLSCACSCDWGHSSKETWPRYRKSGAFLSRPQGQGSHIYATTDALGPYATFSSLSLAIRS
jgi:hypothetical protein